MKRKDLQVNMLKSIRGGNVIKSESGDKPVCCSVCRSFSLHQISANEWECMNCGGKVNKQY